MISFFLPIGVENVVSSYQPISYGFINLFFFPIIFGISIYSLSKYDEHLNNKLINNTVEKNQLITTPTPIKKGLVENTNLYNPIENFIIDAIALIKGDLGQSKTITQTQKLLEFGAISLLAVGGTSLVTLDVLKNSSSKISPVHVESVRDIGNINISSSINVQDFAVKKIRYISSSLGKNYIENNNTYKPYLVSHIKFKKENFVRVIFA